MHSDSLRVLLIEDSESDIRIIEETLGEIDSPHFEVTAVNTLRDGLALHDSQFFDAIVLDLDLPDSDNTTTMKRVNDRVHGTPVVVLTRSVDETFGIEALRHGAQDFVPKSDLRTRLLARSISFSIERAAVVNSMRQEMRWLEALYSFSVDSSQKEVRPSTRFPGMVDIESSRLERQYLDLLETTVDQRGGRAEDNRARAYFKLASEFGKRDASPKDLAKMHSEVLKHIEEKASPDTSREYIDSGRQVLLNLMGYLADYYRRNAIKDDGKDKGSHTNSGKSDSGPRE